MLKSVTRPVALAMLMLAMVTVSARAVSGVSVSPGGSIELVSSGAIVIAPRGAEEGIVTCNLTLSGTLNNGLVGIAGEGTQIGTVTGMRWESCSGGEVEGVLNLGWPITIQRLDGVDPILVGAGSLTQATIAIKGIAVSLTRLGSGSRCLAGGGAAEGLELVAPLALAEGSYSLGTATAEATLLTHTEGCLNAVYSGSFAAFAPSQTLTFLAREELRPNPLEFGNVGVRGLAQRTLVVSSTRGGRIEQLAVRTGRYFGVLDPNGCSGSVLAPGGICIFRVVVSAPAEAGRALSDTVTARVAGRTFEAAVRAST